MADVRAPLRVLDELLWTFRRRGFTIATSQAIDAARAAQAVGFASREKLRDALSAVIVKRAHDQERFARAFDAYFAREPRRDLWERLDALGFAAPEIDVLRELLRLLPSTASDRGLLTWLSRGAELDRLLSLAESEEMLAGMKNPLQKGFFVHRLLDDLGAWRAEKELLGLRLALIDALGAERAEALVAALKRELDEATGDVRGFVNEASARDEEEARAKDDPLGVPFASLDEREILRVRKAVRVFVERLRGGERVRRRRAKKGRIDPRRTLRSALATGGVPFELPRRARRRDKPRLVLLCDVSESVRGVAAFFLELTYAAQSLFSRTRSFVFVSELGETTDLFEEEPIAAALGRTFSGGVVPITHNSNYGRVFRSFEERVLRDIDRRTTVVVLGDGRTNYQAASADVLDAIRARARALVWLCPESRAQWAIGDSAMRDYAPKCTSVLEVRSARDLEDAARLLVSLRG